MPTTIGDLLTATQSTLRRETSPASRAAALGEIGRALSLLRADGLSQSPGSERERATSLMSVACSAVTATVRTETSAQSRRLVDLLAVTADAIALMRDQLDSSSRWAVVVALTDVAEQIVDAETTATRGRMPRPVFADAITFLADSTRALSRLAARDPPTENDVVRLDQIIPAPISTATSKPPVNPIDATGLLVSATSPLQPPLSVAEFLAVTIAARRLSEVATAITGSVRHSAEVWNEISAELKPFTDGSRRRHADTPPSVAAARTLVANLDDLHQSSYADDERVRTAVQHLPQLGSNLLDTVNRWGAAGLLVAYARSLPPREDRVAEYIAEYRAAGLIRADPYDLRRVVQAVHRARAYSTHVAATAWVRHGQPSGSIASRLAAVHVKHHQDARVGARRSAGLSTLGRQQFAPNSLAAQAARR